MNRYADEAPGAGLLARLYTRTALTGLGALALVLSMGLIALSIAVFSHAFDDSAEVTLELDRAGSQLATGADVKLHGLIVGRVSHITARPDGSGATLRLSLARDRLGLIPANVTAQVIPKTIFGEKYVDLQLPDDPADQRISAGDVITRDRSKTALETSTVLNNLQPLLETVSPADLNRTLTAMATALDGRGEQLGRTITTSASYARKFGPAVPQLLTDAALSARVGDEYTAASGSILDALDQFTVTARTIVERQQHIAAGLRALRRFAERAGLFVDVTGDDLVKIVNVSEPLVKLLEKYSPELACTVRGVVQAKDRLEAVFADGPYLKARMFLQVSRGAYVPGKDTPKSLDLSGYGPYCPLTPTGGKGTVPFPPIPSELDEIRGTASPANNVNTVPPISLGTTGPTGTGSILPPQGLTGLLLGTGVAGR